MILFSCAGPVWHHQEPRRPASHPTRRLIKQINNSSNQRQGRQSKRVLDGRGWFVWTWKIESLAFSHQFAHFILASKGLKSTPQTFRIRANISRSLIARGIRKSACIHQMQSFL